MYFSTSKKEEKVLNNHSGNIYRILVFSKDFFTKIYIKPLGSPLCYSVK